MNNEHPVTQRKNQFHSCHGPECYNDGGWVYYADGAVRELEPYGALIQPPNAETVEGEYMLAENKLRFARLKLEAAVNEFDHINTLLAHTIPADPDAEIAKLKHLQKVVNERKKLVTTAESALENTRRGQRRAEMRRRMQEQDRRMAEFQHRRRAVRV